MIVLKNKAIKEKELSNNWKSKRKYKKIRRIIRTAKKKQINKLILRYKTKIDWFTWIIWFWIFIMKNMNLLLDLTLQGRS